MKRGLIIELHNILEKLMIKAGISEKFMQEFEIPIILFIMIFIAFIISEIIYRITGLLCRHIAEGKHYGFFQYVIKGKRLRKLAYSIPPICVLVILPTLFNENTVFRQHIEKAAWMWFLISIVISINSLLTIVGESAFTNSKYHDRPIKGFLQTCRIIVIVIALIVGVSILTNKSPIYLIGGLGAFAAVLMLIAKDSIMGFVGGFLLLENDMIRLGDWIEVPGTSINGNVFDISLTIVKVRNWDNTIATIPPYSLINESFINWRGMSESGGRRIARGYTIKLDCIKPCNKKILQQVKGYNKQLDEYIAEKLEYKSAQSTPDRLENSTMETNAGLFRTYAQLYLQKHPMIRRDMIVMVRTLEPTGTGLPIEFYCFTNTTEWEEYEKIQSEIMEHFASVMPLFELYPFQTSGARDTIISGLIEAGFPVERIKGVDEKTIE